MGGSILSPLYYTSLIRNNILRFYTLRSSEFISEKFKAPKAAFFTILCLLLFKMARTANESYFRVGIIHGTRLFINFNSVTVVSKVHMMTP